MPKIETIFCQASDMQKSQGFYEKVFGVTATYASSHWTSFDFDGVTLALHHPLPGATEPYGRPLVGWVCGITVDDLAATKQRAVEAGAVVTQDYHEVPGGVIFGFSDPDGNQLQAIQRGISLKELQ